MFLKRFVIVIILEIFRTKGQVQCGIPMIRWQQGLIMSDCLFDAFYMISHFLHKKKRHNIFKGVISLYTHIVIVVIYYIYGYVIFYDHRNNCFE